VNVGLLSTLAGIRSGPGTRVPAPEPASDGAPFVNALMEALGLAGRTAQADSPLVTDAPTDGAELHSLLALLAESPDGEAGTAAPNVADPGSGASPFDGIPGSPVHDGFSGAAAGGFGRPALAANTPWESSHVVTSTSTRFDSESTTMHASDAASVSHGLDATASLEATLAENPVTSDRGVASSESAGGPSESMTAATAPAGVDHPAPTGGHSSAPSGDHYPATAGDQYSALTGDHSSASAAGDYSVPGAAERIAAAGASAAARPAVPDLPVTEADPSLDKVAPALRTKVEAVIERMRDEFGHEVTVVEGYRSPDRQSHLYEQGRSRPGQVATWTRRSWHSEGLAADLMVDGTYEDPLAYARLQRVAREEGLKTLGSRDMGHVELPGSTAEPESQVVSARPGRRFVGVAQPAPAAAVAAVAHVATPGQWITDAPPEPAAPALSAEVDVIAEASPRTDSEAPPPADATIRSDFGGRLADAQSTSAPGNRIGGSATPTPEAGAAEQVVRIQELRAMAETAQPTRVSVRLDGGEQVRVGLLDRTVDATLDLSDPDRAATIRDRVSELHRALESRGLDLGALNVNGTAGTSATNSWLGGAGDPASELIRTLLGGGAGERGNDGRGSERTFAEERTRNQQGSDSNRSRRDADQEQNQ